MNGDEDLRARRLRADIDARLKLVACRGVRPIYIDIGLPRHDDVRAARLENRPHLLRDGERDGCLSHARRADSARVAAAMTGIEDDRMPRHATSHGQSVSLFRHKNINNEAVRLM